MTSRTWRWMFTDTSGFYDYPFNVTILLCDFCFKRISSCMFRTNVQRQVVLKKRLLPYLRKRSFQVVCEFKTIVQRQKCLTGGPSRCYRSKVWLQNLFISEPISAQFRFSGPCPPYQHKVF